MCNCLSYNAGVGEVDEVRLTPPPSLGITDSLGDPKKAVFVDACIAPVIAHLWANGVLTLDCCCGHNGDFGPPNVMLDTTASSSDARHAATLIAQIDDRSFDIRAWKVCNFNAERDGWDHQEWINGC